MLEVANMSYRLTLAIGLGVRNTLKQIERILRM